MCINSLSYDLTVTLLITESPKALVEQFFGNNAESYEKVASLTTFGRDAFWKEEIIKKIPGCSSVLDLACGTGILTFKIAQKFPDSTITAIDLTEGYLKIARKKLKPYHKISFSLCDAEKLDFDGTFDCIASSYIPKYCNPEILIGKCVDRLNSGGKLILHDFVYPKNKAIRFSWHLYFVILVVAGLFAPRWKDVFKNLPQLIKSSNWVEKYKDTMTRNGLDVEIRYLTLGTSAILTGTKKV